MTNRRSRSPRRISPVAATIATIAVGAGVALFVAAPPAVATGHTVSNRNVSMGLDLSDGVTLTSIHDQVTGHEYLTQPTFMFEFAWNNGVPYRSNNGVAVDGATFTPNTTTIRAHATSVPLNFDITLTANPDDDAVVVRTAVTDTGGEPGFLRMVYPKLQHFSTPGSASNMMGAVPQEVGGVANLNDVPYLGMGLNLDLGLPTAMNVMEVADIYDGAGDGGLFLADLDGDTSRGIAPLQFNLSRTEADAFYTATLKPSVVSTLPRLAIGVHHAGDWHSAVDYYLAAHNPDWTYTNTPAWLRDAGAIYSPTAGGSGGIYLDQQPQAPLTSRITSFTQLPRLLQEARSLGTNVLYLNDFWNGVSNPQGFPPYYDKGDYQPSTALGGSTALQAGISAVHTQGGRVIAYVEPYIIYQYSQIAQKHGPDWGGRDSAGSLDQSFRYYYTMVQPFAPWQDQVLDIVKRLVGSYGFDGVFLDSLGWQMNKSLHTTAEAVRYSSQQWNQGVLRLVDRTRAAIRTIRPDAVVLSETASGPLAHHLDGGVSADFAWLASQNDDHIIASPMRYGLPNDNVFSNGQICAQTAPCNDEGAPAYTITNGQHLNQLNQIYAAGEGLALSQLERPNAHYVRRLVQLRRTYHDALVEGRQAYQPPTGDPAVAAYYYQGTDHRVMTVTNTTTGPYTGNLTLRDPQPGTVWKDMLTNQTFTTSGSGLALTVPATGLRVLVQQGKVPVSPPPTAFPVTTYDPTLLSDTFNDGRLFNHWTAVDGAWSDTGSAVHASNPTADGLITYDLRTGNDFTYAGDVVIDSGAEAGLSFRLSDDGQKGYDVVLSHDDNEVRLADRAGTVIGQWGMPVTLYRPYHLTVDARGSHLVVFVNDVRVIDVHDSDFASGRLGLTSNGSFATYDNLTATASRSAGR